MDDHPTPDLSRVPPPHPGGLAAPDDPSSEPDGRDSRARVLAAEAEEIRRLIDAGAGTPEELRELAARLREHRALEESLWRENVKPALVKENKGRLRGHVAMPREPKATRSPNVVVIGSTMAVLLVVVLIAANTSALVLIVPFVGLLVWAWKQGQDPAD